MSEDWEPTRWDMLVWKIEDFWDDFIEGLEEVGGAAIDLLKNPFMITLLGIGFGLFAISAMGTWWWGW